LQFQKYNVIIIKSLLTSLFQREEIPLFEKEVLDSEALTRRGERGDFK
jgi:hypothetical protein